MNQEAKCPACRKRFDLNLQEGICTRCGADLSLLIQLRQRANWKILQALGTGKLQASERMNLIKSAQPTCRTDFLAPLLTSVPLAR